MSQVERLRVLATGRLWVVQLVAGQESFANFAKPAIADFFEHSTFCEYSANNL